MNARSVFAAVKLFLLLLPLVLWSCRDGEAESPTAGQERTAPVSVQPSTRPIPMVAFLGMEVRDDARPEVLAESALLERWLFDGLIGRTPEPVIQFLPRFYGRSLRAQAGSAEHRPLDSFTDREVASRGKRYGAERTLRAFYHREGERTTIRLTLLDVEGNKVLVADASGGDGEVERALASKVAEFCTASGATLRAGEEQILSRHFLGDLARFRAQARLGDGSRPYSEAWITAMGEYQAAVPNHPFVVGMDLLARSERDAVARNEIERLGMIGTPPDPLLLVAMYGYGFDRNPKWPEGRIALGAAWPNLFAAQSLAIDTHLSKKEGFKEAENIYRPRRTNDPGSLLWKHVEAWAMLRWHRQVRDYRRMGNEMTAELQKQFEEFPILAGELVADILRSNPEDAHGHYMLALVNSRQQKYQEAERGYRASLALDPGYGAAALDQIILYSNSFWPDPEKARAAFVEHGVAAARSGKSLFVHSLIETFLTDYNDRQKSYVHNLQRLVQQDREFGRVVANALEQRLFWREPIDWNVDIILLAETMDISYESFREPDRVLEGLRRFFRLSPRGITPGICMKYGFGFLNSGRPDLAIVAIGSEPPGTELHAYGQAHLARAIAENGDVEGGLAQLDKVQPPPGAAPGGTEFWKKFNLVYVLAAGDEEQRQSAFEVAEQNVKEAGNTDNLVAWTHAAMKTGRYEEVYSFIPEKFEGARPPAPVFESWKLAAEKLSKPAYWPGPKQ